MDAAAMCGSSLTGDSEAAASLVDESFCVPAFCSSGGAFAVLFIVQAGWSPSPSDASVIHDHESTVQYRRGAWGLSALTSARMLKPWAVNVKTPECRCWRVPRRRTRRWQRAWRGAYTSTATRPPPSTACCSRISATTTALPWYVRSTPTMSLSRSGCARSLRSLRLRPTHCPG